MNSYEINKNKEFNNNLNEYEINEFKIKEKLLTLFYELTSELKGKKIEIFEDEFQENLLKYSVFQIIDYIYETLQILLSKYKEKNQIDSNIKIYSNFNIVNNNSDNNQINFINEKLLKYYENKERQNIKLIFELNLKIDSLERKLNDFVLMEKEFNDLKVKVKYDNGKFLENDRKENEILIIRTENSKLKNIINNLEKNVNNFKKKNIEYEKKIDFLTSKISKNNSKNNSNLSTISNNKDLKIFNLKKISNICNFNKNSKLNKKKSYVSRTNKKYLDNNHIRNNSMNLILDKKKYDLVFKYLKNIKTIKNNYNNLNTINLNSDKYKNKKKRNMINFFQYLKKNPIFFSHNVSKRNSQKKTYEFPKKNNINNNINKKNNNHKINGYDYNLKDSLIF